MLASPVMAYTSIMILPDKTETGCCTENGLEHEQSDEPKDCKDDNHCKDCNTHDCCVHMNVLKNFVQQLHDKTQLIVFYEEQSKNENYLSLYIKDITYSFWHPPKYIS